MLGLSYQLFALHISVLVEHNFSDMVPKSWNYLSILRPIMITWKQFWIGQIWKIFNKLSTWFAPPWVSNAAGPPQISAWQCPSNKAQYEVSSRHGGPLLSGTCVGRFCRVHVAVLRVKPGQRSSRSAVYEIRY